MQFSAPRGLSSLAITTPLHCAAYHLIFGHYEVGRPGLHSDTSSSTRRSVWRPRSTDASYARIMSCPWTNSFVILATNPQVLSGCCPKINVRKTSLKMGGLLQTLSAACNVGSLSFGQSSSDVRPGQSRTLRCPRP
jgi:hypothetical protein